MHHPASRRAPLLPCPAPERHRAQRFWRFLLKEILLQVRCFRRDFPPRTVLSGKGTALKWGMLCNGALCTSVSSLTLMSRDRENKQAGWWMVSIQGQPTHDHLPLLFSCKARALS